MAAQALEPWCIWPGGHGQSDGREPAPDASGLQTSPCLCFPIDPAHALLGGAHQCLGQPATFDLGYVGLEQARVLRAQRNRNRMLECQLAAEDTLDALHNLASQHFVRSLPLLMFQQQMGYGMYQNLPPAPGPRRRRRRRGGAGARTGEPRHDEREDYAAAVHAADDARALASEPEVAQKKAACERAEAKAGEDCTLRKLQAFLCDDYDDRQLSLAGGLTAVVLFVLFRIFLLR
ncbi:hypothetical protein JL722_2078 [Aureococcus anophagefferens]|nr:hypothetical protein JL722_2078 [Aureococcus anophagefferens]